MGIEIEEDQALQFRRLLTLQKTVLHVTDPDTVSSTATTATHPADQLLVIPQPFPQLLRLAATDQRIFCEYGKDEIKR